MSQQTQKLMQGSNWQAGCWWLLFQDISVCGKTGDRRQSETGRTSGIQHFQVLGQSWVKQGTVH